MGALGAFGAMAFHGCCGCACLTPNPQDCGALSTEAGSCLRFMVSEGGNKSAAMYNTAHILQKFRRRRADSAFINPMGATRYGQPDKGANFVRRCRK